MGAALVVREQRNDCWPAFERSFTSVVKLWRLTLDSSPWKEGERNILWPSHALAIWCWVLHRCWVLHWSVKDWSHSRVISRRLADQYVTQSEPLTKIPSHQIPLLTSVINSQTGRDTAAHHWPTWKEANTRTDNQTGKKRKKNFYTLWVTDGTLKSGSSSLYEQQQKRNKSRSLSI